MNAMLPLNFGAAKQTIPMFYFQEGTTVVIDGVNFTPVKQTLEGSILRNPEEIEEFFSHERLYVLHCQDKIKINRRKSALDPNQSSLLDAPTEKQAKSLYYADLLNEFIRWENSGKRPQELSDAGFTRKVSLGKACLELLLPILKEAVDKRWKLKRAGKGKLSFETPHPRHFKRLHDIYAAAHFDPRSLVGQMGKRPRLSQHHPEDLRVWVEYVRMYCDVKAPTIKACYEQLEAKVHALNIKRKEDGLRLHLLPSQAVFGRMVRSLGKFHLTYTRKGEEYARAKFAIVNEGLLVERPGERVEMDEWKVDLIVLLTHAGLYELMTPEERDAIARARIWATVAIDVATKCILGMRFSVRAPSHASSLACLEMVVTNKTHISEAIGAGSSWIYALVPEEIATDSGSAFIDSRFRAAVATLLCVQSFPAAGWAAGRGTIENFFKTCGQRFLHWFEGRTFSSILTKGRYDAKGRACLNVDELNKLLVRAIVDVYHHTPHAGLGGETPHNAWMRLSKKYGMIMPLHSDQRREVFGTRLTRKISDKGVRFLGLHYNHPKIQEIRYQQSVLPNAPTPKVAIRVDRFDLSRISWWDGKEWLEAVSTVKLPRGVSVWEWVGAAQDLARTHKENAKPGLSIRLKAINSLREEGHAAAARAELGADIPSEVAYNKAESEYFKEDVVDDLDEQLDLSDLRNPYDPIKTSITAFRHLAVTKEAKKNAGKKSVDEVAEEVAPKPDESGFSGLDALFLPDADPESGIDYL